MPFKKGAKPHNKGKTKKNYEPLKKVSKKLKGRRKSEAHKEKVSKALKGIHKGMSYEEIYGEEKAKQLRKLRSIVNKKRMKRDRPLFIGDANPAKHPTIRKKISVRVKRKWQEPQHRKKHLEANMKALYTPEVIDKRSKSLRKTLQSPEARKKISIRVQKNWQDEEIRKRHVKGILKALFRRPTNLEQTFITLFETNNLPFDYCGDGNLIIGGKCPDFRENNGRKLCIEVANKINKSVFNKVTVGEYETQRINHFGEYGWRCLVLWSKELGNKGNLLNKVLAFLGRDI